VPPDGGWDRGAFQGGEGTHARGGADAPVAGGAAAARAEDGAAAVEFAVLLPLLVVLLLGFVQFGIAAGDRIQATSAAREAARLAVVGIDDWHSIGGSGKPFWQVVSEQSGLGELRNCRLVTDDVVGGILTVSFDFPVDLAVPFVPGAPSSRTGTATASMRIERLSAALGPGGC
jgi:Flp pilus assembly pilin Flp